jgi:hypothetical protein
MATKKSAQSRAGKKRTSKKGRKKPGRKPDIPPRMDQANPPIIVGGGGSTIIWMRKSLSPVEIDPSTLPAAAPRPADVTLYKCFKCNVDIHVATVTKGIGGIPAVFSGMSAGRCIITFDV